MLPVANLHKLYDTTVEFFSLRTPSTQSPTTPEQHLRVLTPVTDPVARLTRECASLRDQLNKRELTCLQAVSKSRVATAFDATRA